VQTNGHSHRQLVAVGCQAHRDIAAGTDMMIIITFVTTLPAISTRYLAHKKMCMYMQDLAKFTSRYLPGNTRATYVNQQFASIRNFGDCRGPRRRSRTSPGVSRTVLTAHRAHLASPYLRKQHLHAIPKQFRLLARGTGKGSQGDGPFSDTLTCQ
jgi:hypothetical protein